MTRIAPRHAFTTLLLTVAILTAGPQAAPGGDPVKARLLQHLDTIKVVDCHEHERVSPEYEGQRYNFYTILSYSYLQYDLVAAGGKAPAAERINAGDLNELWTSWGRYLDFGDVPRERAETLFARKLFWGGDSHFIEEAAGSLEIAKDVVAEVLANRVNRGLLSEPLARDIATAIFRSNALEFFHLPGR